MEILIHRIIHITQTAVFVFPHHLDILIQCIVQTDGSRLHGIVNFLYHRSTWAAQDVCYLEDLYVSPDVRGQQIGKQLIEYVRRQAEERRCARLYWHTQESNHRAQRLYDWVADKPVVIEYRIEL